jgi:hypothetical protein
LFFDPAFGDSRALGWGVDFPHQCRAIEDRAALLDGLDHDPFPGQRFADPAAPALDVDRSLGRVAQI